jgi:SAM-dependent methyltransferase
VILPKRSGRARASFIVEPFTREVTMNYELAYAVGFHPWEDAKDQPAFVETITALFADEERGHAPPFGHALDLGTGSGIWALELARRGWDVTGVDNVGRALRRARRQAESEGLAVRFIEGDVTALTAAGLEPDFRLLVDTGTFHGLSADQRRAMGREVETLAAADATILLLAWEPRRRGPLPRGASADEIRAAFPGWRITDVTPSHFEAPPPVERFLRPDEHWYRLRRA